MAAETRLLPTFPPEGPRRVSVVDEKPEEGPEEGGLCSQDRCWNAERQRDRDRERYDRDREEREGAVDDVDAVDGVGDDGVCYHQQHRIDDREPCPSHEGYQRMGVIGAEGEDDEARQSEEDRLQDRVQLPEVFREADGG
jgi:hypothetical protein